MSLISNFNINSPIDDNYSLDDSKRINIGNSFWLKITHFCEKRKLDSKIQQEVSLFFQQKYGFLDQKAFKQTWNAIGGKIWTPSKQLTAGIMRQIDAAFAQEIIYHGAGIPAPEVPNLEVDKNIQTIVQTLLHGEEMTFGLVQQKIIRAIFIAKDHYFLDHFRLELQSELDNLLHNPPKNSKEEVLWRAFLGNIIALLPFTYPTNTDTISIPVLKDGVCRSVNYSMQIIPLHYPEVSSPMPAIGLTPKDINEKADPFISFIGTTYPAGDGFIATLLADFTPFHSVGESVFKHNRQVLDQWFEGKKNVQAVGISLGGAMALHAYRHYPEKLCKVDAYNPPGLYESNWKEEINSECPVNIYCQSGDFVSYLGHWPTSKNISLFRVIPHHKGLKRGMYNAHARVYTGCDYVTILKKNPSLVNQSVRRRLLTILHRWLGPLLIYFPLKSSVWLYNRAKSIGKWAASFFSKE